MKIKLSLEEYSLLESIIKKTPLPINLDYLGFYLRLYDDFNITFKGLWYYYIIRNLVVRKNKGKEYFLRDKEESILYLKNEGLIEDIK